MADDVKVTCKPVHHGTIMGSVWIIGWLFTVGYLNFAFWKGVLALFFWPYYLGAFLHK